MDVDCETDTPSSTAEIAKTDDDSWSDVSDECGVSSEVASTSAESACEKYSEAFKIQDAKRRFKHHPEKKRFMTHFHAYFNRPLSLKAVRIYKRHSAMTRLETIFEHPGVVFKRRVPVNPQGRYRKFKMRLNSYPLPVEKRLEELEKQMWNLDIERKKSVASLQNAD